MLRIDGEHVSLDVKNVAGACNVSTQTTGRICTGGDRASFDVSIRIHGL
jgi:hypothetical protein